MRQQGKEVGANLVEIDLVLQGRPTLESSRESLPALDYAVTVTRAVQPERYEIYTATLQKRLPRFRMPLAPTDRDLVLDLPALFARSYDQAGFGGRIDYQDPPAVPLSEENRQWLDELLRGQQLREQPVSPVEKAPPVLDEAGALHEKIALAAYYLWQQEGCPNGRGKEHWHKAVEQLRRQAEAE